MDTLPAADSSTLTYFVSYAWSMPFTLLVELLSHHLHAADPKQVREEARAGPQGHSRTGLINARTHVLFSLCSFTHTHTRTHTLSILSRSPRCSNVHIAPRTQCCMPCRAVLPRAQVYCWVDVLAINQNPGRQQARDLEDLEVRCVCGGWVGGCGGWVGGWGGAVVVDCNHQPKLNQ